MPTMSTYELKITGLVKADDPNPAEVFARFKALMDWGTPWADKFGLVYEQAEPLKKDTAPIHEWWGVPIGSVLAEMSVVAVGSTLNGQKVQGQPHKVPVDTHLDITDHTVLAPGSIVAKGSTLRRAPWVKMAWEIRMEESPRWDLGADGKAFISGNYQLLVMQGIMGVVRPGAFGENWDNESAPDELWWFYKYKSLPWFKELMAALITFNRAFASRLEESARVRDLKWYCGNGAGP
jgi:hypothetical protein